MNFAQVIRTVLEAAVIIFTLWAVFHEDRFIKFEDRIASHFRRRRLKIISGSSVHSTCHPNAAKQN